MTARDPRSVARARTITAVFLVIVGLLYVVVLAVYNPGGSVVSKSTTPDNPDVVFEIDILGIDPENYSALTRMRAVDIAEGLIDANYRTIDNLRVGVWSEDGPEEIVFPAGTPVGRVEAAVGITGDFSGYPFDSYVSEFTVDAFAGDRASGAPLRPLVVAASVVDGTSGWRIDTESATADSGYAEVRMDIARSFSSQFFALLTVAMGLVVAVFSLAVGISVLSGRHFVDSSIVGWGAGLIFSLLALRFYMPGDPPVGV
ncbi:MAG: hypothetical protein RJB01_1218, partial [Actinomycetota bacterium]